MKTLNQQVWSIKQKHHLKGGTLGLSQVGHSPPQSTQNLGSEISTKLAFSKALGIIIDHK
jgi:hypothetical protein